MIKLIDLWKEKQDIELLKKEYPNIREEGNEIASKTLAFMCRDCDKKLAEDLTELLILIDWLIKQGSLTPEMNVIIMKMADEIGLDMVSKGIILGMLIFEYEGIESFDDATKHYIW